jgi:hypothetical protein
LKSASIFAFLSGLYLNHPVIYHMTKTLGVPGSVAEPEPHHLVGAGAGTRCGSGSGSNGSGSDNGIKHG